MSSFISAVSIRGSGACGGCKAAHGDSGRKHEKSQQYSVSVAE